MKVNLNLTPKMQGFGMQANKSNAKKTVKNGAQRAANEMQQRAQNVQDAYYNYKNQQLSLMLDSLMNGSITDRKKRPTLSEETKNDPRISDEIKNKAAVYDAYERGHVTYNRGQNEYLG